MSTNRRLVGAGWYREKQIGPGGRPLCRWCKQEIQNLRRSTFCGKDCVHEWRIRSDAGYARAKVEERDHGVCQLCGVGTERVSRVLDALRASLDRGGWRDDGWPADHWRVSLAGARARTVIGHLRARGWPVRMTAWPTGRAYIEWRSLWEMDHLVPVAEGGGECGLDNLRTLCVPCHRNQTKALNARLLARRRAMEGGRQTLLQVLRAEPVIPSADGSADPSSGHPALGGTVEPAGAAAAQGRSK